MRKNLNTTGVAEQGEFEVCEKGDHYAHIEEVREAITQNGDDMASVKFVVDSGASQDSWVWDNIVISDNPDSPGYKVLGRTKHFLHCIGEPYEGEIKVDTDNWKGKKVKIRVDHEQPNQYHKSIRPIVTAYLIDEEQEKEEGPDL